MIWPAMAIVTIGGGIASYLTTLGVVQVADGHAAVAFIVAALADPVILAASADIRDAHRRGHRRPRWSSLSLGVAIGMTTYLNVMAAYRGDVPPWLVRAWVPVAFLLTLESLMSYTRRGRGVASLTPAAGDDGAPAAHGHPAATVAAPTREWLDGHLRAFRATMSEREVSEVLGISRGRVSAAVTTDPPAPGHAEVTGAGVSPNGRLR